ncbi:MAG: MBL fold metallo-hydrolase [Haloechinothrix sp.]
MTHPAYGELRQVSPFASVLLENNPSSMTLEGTNSWVVRAPGATASVVIDPGYDDRAHLGKLVEAAGEVALVLLTHHHGDHSEGAPWFADRVQAPVRALDREYCRLAPPLEPDELIEAADMRIRVLHTPGHTADSVSLLLEQPERPHVFTGDTILGRGTTVLSDLGDYLRSLRALTGVSEGTVGLPGHGPELPDLLVTVREYLEHREQRLDQVRGALRQLGPDAGARQIVELVYADVDPVLWGPAEFSVRAQVDYLRSLE